MGSGTGLGQKEVSNFNDVTTVAQYSVTLRPRVLGLLTTLSLVWTPGKQLPLNLNWLHHRDFCSAPGDKVPVLLFPTCELDLRDLWS